MRKRKMSYENYGMSKKEVRYIKDFCRNASEDEKKFIKNALSELQPYIEPYVYYSLVNNVSYDIMSAKNYIYIGKGDFYGHRRQGMDAIKQRMIDDGIWEM